MTSPRSVPVDLGNDVWMIDLLEQGARCRTAAYFIRDEKLTLIETGSSLSHDLLVEALAQLDVKPEDLDYVIVTHVHLDHAGGAGHMMERARDATLVCHPRAARHMIDPSRLWGGAEQVYGAALPQLFGSIKPVPEARVLIRHHEETLDIGRRTLTFFDSPGHAKHHFTILDPVSDALFAGDAVGIFYPTGFTGWSYEWVMPSTSPTDFDPVAIHNTMAMLQQVPFTWVYHAHFGRSKREPAMRDTARVADAFAEIVGGLPDDQLSVPIVADALRTWVKADLRAHGFDPGDDLSVLDLDMTVDAMGLIHYEQKRRQAK
ncbi:MBL fold metallo-hydrolase [Alicyclobacillus cycloheptanicus]|nr:MBL fold metallo-hydrolase [Alicyclobacillus cycloheptanicus]WDM01671.1 MBL fold metallo-hydrolase [Alicyclobacillus cycloheptanicus]